MRTMMTMKKWIQIGAALLLVILVKPLLQGDAMAFIRWWLTIVILGLIYMPLTSMIFARFYDKGYLFSKTIGIAASSYLMWLLSSLHLMKFNEISTILCVVIGLILNGILLIMQRKKNNSHLEVKNSLFLNILKENGLSSMITQELLFFGLFLLFTYVRGFKPEAYGTEKFMDYGFMTSMLRSDYMPPQDFWYSGTKLNYYYVGQFIAAYLTRLSFVEVTVSYNLMLMMVGAFAFVLPYSLVSNLVHDYVREQGKQSGLFSTIGGLLAGTAVCFAGNMHYPTYRWFEPLVRKFFGMEQGTDSYWFPDATRFIGYHPETTDKTIHEFPAYSFVLGDLHAHVINVMFVLTVLGILYAWIKNKVAEKGLSKPLWKDILSPEILLLCFFIGLFHTTNFWDFPIYYVVSGAVILFTNLNLYQVKGKVPTVTTLQGIAVMLLSYLVCLPFTLNFDQISTTPRLAVAHTPINQLIILWGLPIVTVISFLCFVLSKHMKDHKAETKEEHKDTSVIRSILGRISGTDLFVLLLGLCAIGLVLIPEVIYIEDIYSGDYKRANTMFKLTYQAFIMFGLCFGYIYVRLLRFGETKRQRKYAGISLLFFLLSVCYIQNAVNAWYGNIFDRTGYEGLDATAFMDEVMPDDALAADWLNENVTGIPVVLEANGDSYTDYQRISVITGLPTILGWRTHEWLWKGDPTLLDVRAADIEAIYTSTDSVKVKELLEQYKVSYIYVGKLEEEKYDTINHSLLKSLGTVVFSSPATEDKSYETYIIQLAD